MSDSRGLAWTGGVATAQIGVEEMRPASNRVSSPRHRANSFNGHSVWVRFMRDPRLNRTSSWPTAPKGGAFAFAESPLKGNIRRIIRAWRSLHYPLNKL